MIFPLRYTCPKCDTTLIAEQDPENVTPVLCSVCGLIFIDPWYRLKIKLQEARTVAELMNPLFWV